MTDGSTHVISDAKCRNCCCIFYCDNGCGAIKLQCTAISVTNVSVRLLQGVWRETLAYVCLLLLHVRVNWYIIQRDSKIWTQFRTSIFPELYMACEWSTYHLKEEVLYFQIPPLERSPSAPPCSSISWEQNGYCAAQGFLLSWVH